MPPVAHQPLAAECMLAPHRQLVAVHLKRVVGFRDGGAVQPSAYRLVHLRKFFNEDVQGVFLVAGCAKEIAVGQALPLVIHE
jgi:hypothetical protein